MKESYGEKIPLMTLNVIDEGAQDILLISLEEFFDRCRDKIESPHRITYYQLAVISEGEGIVWADSERCEIKPMTMIAAPKGKVMCGETGRGIKGYMLLFTEDFINRNREDIERIKSLGLFNALSKSPLVPIKENEYVEIISYLKKIEREIELREDPISREIIFTLLKTVVLNAERIYLKHNFAEAVSTNGSGYILQFQKELEEAFNNSRTVNYYANQLGITPRKLNQATVASCGVSAKQMIEDRVLLETKRLLTHTQMTIKEIGHSMGFNDPTNFNKFFKRYVKQTPLEFRELNRKYYKSTKRAGINHFQSAAAADN